MMTDSDDSTETSGLDAQKQESYIRLLSAVHPRLFGLLISLLGNRHDAEDVLQRTSVLLWRKFDTFEPNSDFWAWSSSFAFYEAMNFRRVAARSRLQFSDALLQTMHDERREAKASGEARMIALRECFEQLDLRERRLLEEVYQEGAEIVDLAARTGRAPQTLYNRLSALRRALAHCVEGKLAEEWA